MDEAICRHMSSPGELQQKLAGMGLEPWFLGLFTAGPYVQDSSSVSLSSSPEAMYNKAGRHSVRPLKAVTTSAQFARISKPVTQHC